MSSINKKLVAKAEGYLETQYANEIGIFIFFNIK